MFDPSLSLQQNFENLSDYLQHHLVEVTNRLAHAAEKPCPTPGHWHAEYDKYLTGLTTLTGRYFLVRALPDYPEALFELHSVESDRGMEQLDSLELVRFENANPADIVNLGAEILPFLHHTDHRRPEPVLGFGGIQSLPNPLGAASIFNQEPSPAAVEAFPRFAYRFQRFVLDYAKERDSAKPSELIGVEHVYEHGGVFFLLVHGLPSPVLALFEDHHEWHEANVFDPEDAGVELLDSLMGMLAQNPPNVEAYSPATGKGTFAPPKMQGGFSMN